MFQTLFCTLIVKLNMYRLSIIFLISFDLQISVQASVIYIVMIMRRDGYDLIVCHYIRFVTVMLSHNISQEGDRAFLQQQINCLRTNMRDIAGLCLVSRSEILLRHLYAACVYIKIYGC